jgi:predicted HicB family RNase H-like nuclease
MSNTMFYKGYTTSMTFDADDKVIVGRVLDIDDIILFHGESVAEFETNFHAAVGPRLGPRTTCAWQGHAANCTRGSRCSTQGSGKERHQPEQVG